MRKIINGIVYYRFISLEKYYPELKHIVTTRAGGYSRGLYHSLNIGFHVGDNETEVIRNRRLICNQLGYTLDSLVAMKQNHGANVEVIDYIHRGRGARKWEDGITHVDGMITNNKNIVLMSMSADCSLCIFYDPQRKVLGLAHSGWSGIVKGIIRNMIAIMEKTFLCKRCNIVVAIGPTICEKCYEIGDDVAKSFEDTFPNNKGTIFSKTIHGAKTLNIVKCIELQLLTEGVMLNHIESSHICNSCQTNEFFSYRKEKKNTGRMGIFAVISESN